MRKELNDIIISALAVALAFAIAFSGGIEALSNLRDLAFYFLIALIGVSSGFVLHEIGHRFVARRLGCFAEYTMWPTGLLVAIALSLFGFVFAAPGAVRIYPATDAYGRSTLTLQKEGLISITGPAMNLLLGAIFLLLDFLYPWAVFGLGARINTWLAIFNLIPFGPLDGAKIMRWNKGAWLIVLLVAAGLYALQLVRFQI